MHFLLDEAFVKNKNILSVHDFMALANKIYYQQGTSLGPGGDFVTAPELSSLLGEIIGLSLVDAWQRMGNPSVFDLIECGPGRGLLMQDVLRITQPFHGFHQGLSLKFIEINKHFSFPSFPYHIFEELPQALSDKPTFFIANEFFDAFPIHQHTLREGTLSERFIHKSPQGLSFSYAEEDHIIETCPEGQRVFEKMAAHLKKWGGAGVVIDYGHALKDKKGNTLQSVYKNKMTHPLDYPGRQDLTAHVNFAAFISCLESYGPALRWQFQTQRAFLLARGAYVRLQQVLKAKLPPGRLQDYQEAFHRLTGVDAMGTLFKALWIEGVKVC